MEEIAKKLKTFRLANRMTLKDLASKAGCTDAYLSQLERGHVNPSITTLKKRETSLTKLADRQNGVLDSYGYTVWMKREQGDSRP